MSLPFVTFSEIGGIQASFLFLVAWRRRGTRTEKNEQGQLYGGSPEHPYRCLGDDIAGKCMKVNLLEYGNQPGDERRRGVTGWRGRLEGADGYAVCMRSCPTTRILSAC